MNFEIIKYDAIELAASTYSSIMYVFILWAMLSFVYKGRFSKRLRDINDPLAAIFSFFIAMMGAINILSFQLSEFGLYLSWTNFIVFALISLGRICTWNAYDKDSKDQNDWPGNNPRCT